MFAGGWTLHAAQAVCDCESLELTSALVRKSLVVVHQEAARETRYDFHEMIRNYAWEKLLEAGEEEMIRDRHLDYFLEHVVAVRACTARGGSALLAGASISGAR